MKSFKECINETTLSRVWKHFNDNNMAVLIISAFRGNYTEQQNISRNKKLASEAKKRGFGYFYVDGHWIEKNGNNEIYDGKEDSLLILSENSDKLKSFGMEMMDKYEQDAILFKPSNDGTYLIFNDGSSNKLGKMRIKDIERIKTELQNSDNEGSGYTKLRNRGERTFVFEKARIEKGWLVKSFGGKK